MIEITPLDVRKKGGDFQRELRGYAREEVDTFLELVAERLEALVKENLTLRERTEGLQSQVESQAGRERAVQEALVTAQALRDEIRSQAEREAALHRERARAEIQAFVDKLEARLERARAAVDELERRRRRFLAHFRSLLERELDAVEVEEGRPPLDEDPIEVDFADALLDSIPIAPAPAATLDEAGGAEEPTPTEEAAPPRAAGRGYDALWEEEPEVEAAERSGEA